MNRDQNVLHPYEFDQLLEALRRDYRAQMDLSITDSQWSTWHATNARMAKRILEALNPKKTGQYGTIRRDHVLSEQT